MGAKGNNKKKMSLRTARGKWWKWWHETEKEMSPEDRKARYDRYMSLHHGNIIVRCPACGKLSLVPNTGRKRWKCPCTPKRSRFVREDALPDQKHLTLERGVTDFAGQEYPRLSHCWLLEEVTVKGYDRIADCAFNGCDHLRTVRLLDGITQIGRHAFHCCNALESVDLPDSLTEIGSGAFMFCTALKKIDLPDRLTEIDDNTFALCTALEQIGLPDSVTRIGDGAFDDCSALKKVDLPDSLTKIGNEAFINCFALEELTLPSGLVQIDYRAFTCCKLRKVVLPDTLQQLGDGAFYGCMELDEVEIPPKLLVGMRLDCLFGDTPFYKNHYEGILQFRPDGSIEISASLRTFVQLAGRWPQPVFLHCESDPEPSELAGPVGADERRQMEESLQKIVTLELEGSTIHAWQFCGCGNLKRLILPGDLEQIEEGAFARCTALEELVIPESVALIGPKAFLGCSSLRHVRMDEQLLKTLDDSVFEGTPFWQDPELRRQTFRRSDALLVFLGYGAGNTAVTLCKKESCRQDLLLLDTSLDICSEDCIRAIWEAPGPDVEKPRFYTIQLGKSFLKDRCFSGCPERGIQALREAKDEIRSLVRQYRFVIAVTNPVGRTGSSITLLAQWLREMGIPHTILAGMPFGFEGREMGAAQNALNELRESPLIEISYEEIKQRAEDKGIRVTRENAFELADQELCRQIEQLLAQNGLQ